MEVPAEVVVTMHTINRIRLRFPPLQRFNQDEIVAQVKQSLQSALAVCDTQDHRKIVAAPICEMDTIYLVTKVDGDVLFVITCLTEKMVKERIRQVQKFRFRMLNSCPYQIHGKKPERRRRVRQNRFRTIEEADE